MVAKPPSKPTDPAKPAAEQDADYSKLKFAKKSNFDIKEEEKKGNQKPPSSKPSQSAQVSK